MAAMRLMHAGLDAHLIGAATTPAVVAGDLVLVASASGTTASILHQVEKARSLGADVVALTATPASPLAQLAAVVISVRAGT